MLMCFKFQYRMVDIKITVVGKANTADICYFNMRNVAAGLINNIDQHLQERACVRVLAIIRASRDFTM